MIERCLWEGMLRGLIARRSCASAALVCLAWLVLAAAAHATTKTFQYTGSEQQFTVPSGVTSVYVVAVGAPGGTSSPCYISPCSPRSGGPGATAAADLAVTPGEVLYVEVGGPGSSGGFNGGGPGGCGCAHDSGGGGGGGGGASDLRTVSASNTTSTLNSRVIIAAGGGGGGGRDGGGGGAGGWFGSPLVQCGTGWNWACGGGAATATGGGAGGPAGGGDAGHPCSGIGGGSGSLGVGGAGGSGGIGSPLNACRVFGGGGGGGGGGLYGGGGGGGGYGGGGGGGGSSGFGPGTTNALVSAPEHGGTDTPSISITYLPVLTVTNSGTGAGRVSSSPAGISCGAACQYVFPLGTWVTLTATPASGSQFAGWSGACSGTGACNLTMNADTSAQAKFTVIPPPDTTITGVSTSSAQRRATFDFKGSGGAGTLHFQCKLDSGAWTGCTSPKTYKRLSKGRHTFQVRAIDSRGKTDPTPAKRTVTI